METVYNLDNILNNIIQGDSAEELKKLPDNCIDLTVTSPPYDNIRDYHGFVFDSDTIIRELYRVTKPGGVVVWIVSDQTINGSETGTSFKQALFFKVVGFNLHDTMIWEKSSPAFPESNRYNQVFEYMFIFSKGKPKTFNAIKDRKNKWSGSSMHGTTRQKNGETIHRNYAEEIAEYGNRFNIWEISEEKNNKTGHPAVFPYQLARDHIITWSNPGDIVLDPFSGSGTTAIAAERSGRNYIGIEISKDYLDISIQRIKRETAQQKLFFNERGLINE